MKPLFCFILCLSFLTPLQANQNESQSQLGASMDELSSLLKSIRRIDEDDWTGKAAVARQAQDELLKCFPLIPSILKGETDENETAKQLAVYRKLIAKNYVQLCNLELAFLEEDEDLADDVMRELKSVKKDGHTQFIEEE